MNEGAVAFLVIVGFIALWIGIDQYRLRKIPKQKKYTKDELEELAQLLGQLEEVKNKKRGEVENMINAGEQLLKLKEFQEPKTKELFEKAIRDLKKSLKDSE